MSATVISSPHGARMHRVERIMLQVLLALIPGIAAMIWLFGWGVLINILLASAVAVAAEAVTLKARGRPVGPAIGDLSAVVTAVLLAIAVPPSLPWWLTVLGVLFAIVIVKQLYGGLGYNPFNPAMAGYVFLLISYPVAMTSWLPPLVLADQQLTFLDSLRMIFLSATPSGVSWDAVTMATPLDAMRTALEEGETIAEIRRSPLWGEYGGRGWEWLSVWFLVGGLFLLWRRVISWQIPLSMLAGLSVMAAAFWWLDPQTHPSPVFHLLSGGTMLCAFFIATDPVTACTTRRGQLIFGASIGVLVFIIRSWGGYPDAVAFAVLLMNIAAPTLEQFTQPRVFGHGRVVDE